jgi:DNA primase
MSIIDQIRDKTDILDLMQKEGVHLKKHGKLWKAICPFHSEKTPSFVVYPDGKWRCFGACGIGGDVLDFYQRRHNVDLKDAIDELAQRAGIERTHSHSSKHLERMYGVLKVAAETFERLLWLPRGKVAMDYIAARGITGDDAKYWQLGYAPAGKQDLYKYLTQLDYSPQLLEAVGLIINQNGKWLDRFHNRLMFPIHDERGRVVGFGARALDADTNPKYTNSPETALFHKTNLLYGMHRAKDAIRKHHEAIVVEGYMDAISAHRAGYQQVVASMGTALTEEQMKQLRYADRIILATDGDKAGKDAIIRGVQHAGTLQADIRIALLAGDMDPDDAIRLGLWDDCIKNTIPVTRYLIQRAINTLPDDASNVEKVKLAKKLLPLLMAAESNLFQKASIQELALELGLDYHILMQHAEPPPQPEQPPIPTRTSPTIEMSVLATIIAHPEWYDEMEADLIFIDKPLRKNDFSQLHHIWTLIVQARENNLDAHDYIHEMGSDIMPDCETLDKPILWRQILNLRLRYLTEQIDMALATHDNERYKRLHQRRVSILREFRKVKISRL